MKLIALLLSFASFLAAQGAGSVAGVVMDPSGARVPNAKVTVISLGSGEQTNLVTDAIGQYAVAGLADGKYAVEARVPGFVLFRTANVVVEKGGQVPADVHLVMGSVSESMRVTAPGTKAVSVGDGGRVKVGGNVKPAKLTLRVPAAYPPNLQAQGLEGVVSLEAVIGKDGSTMAVRVTKSGGYREFNESALEAVRQWRYEPSELNGEPVEVTTKIEIEFKLAN